MGLETRLGGELNPPGLKLMLLWVQAVYYHIRMSNIEKQLSGYISSVTQSYKNQSLEVYEFGGM